MDLLIFGGQGTSKLPDIRRLFKRKEGKELIQELKSSGREDWVETINDLLMNNLSSLRYEMFATFFANDIYWRRVKNNNINIDALTSYSAGIFNIVSTYYSIPTHEMLDFISKRASIFEKYVGNKHLFLYMSNDWSKLIKLYKDRDLDFDSSIISNDNVGVISTDSSTINKFQEIADNHDIDVKFHDSGISIPYHSKYLSQFYSEYSEAVDILFKNIDIKNGVNDFKLIIESKDLKDEVIRQLDGTIHWNKIIKKISSYNFDTIFDTSANEYLVRQMRNNDMFKNSDCVGKLLWRMK